MRSSSPAGARAAVSLGRARAAVVVAFVVQGVSFASLVTRIPALQDRFSLGEGALAVLLVVVPVVAGVGSVVAGALAPRFGSRALLRVLGPVTPLSLVLVGAAPSLPVLVLGLVLLGIGLGSVDATMNMQAVDVQHAYGRPVMSSFYAFFSLATIVGAALAAAAAAAGLPLLAMFAVQAAVFVPVQVVVGRWLRAEDERAARPEAAAAAPGAAAVPWRPIVLIGIALTCVYVLDSGASNWSAVYLTDALGSAESTAALAYAAYALALLVARVVVDRLVVRFGPVLLVRVGGVVAAVSVALVAVAPAPVAGLLAFALLGLGVAPAIPLAFTAAASHDPDGTGQAVARVNVFNYAGFVLGAPLVGAVAEATSLRWGFAVLVPVALAIAGLAGAFRAPTS